VICFVVTKIVGASPAIFSVMEKAASDAKIIASALRKASWLQNCCLDEEDNRLDRKEMAPTTVKIDSGAPTVV
jgi:hypothetical protein